MSEIFTKNIINLSEKLKKVKTYQEYKEVKDEILGDIKLPDLLNYIALVMQMISFKIEHDYESEDEDEDETESSSDDNQEIFLSTGITKSDGSSSLQ